MTFSSAFFLQGCKLVGDELLHVVEPSCLDVCYGISTLSGKFMNLLPCLFKSNKNHIAVLMSTNTVRS